MGSNNLWCLRTPRSNSPAGSQHQAITDLSWRVSASFSIARAPFSCAVAPPWAAWKTLLKIPSWEGQKALAFGVGPPVRDNPPLHPSRNPGWCRRLAWMAPLKSPLGRGRRRQPSGWVLPVRSTLKRVRSYIAVPHYTSFSIWIMAFLAF